MKKSSTLIPANPTEEEKTPGGGRSGREGISGT